MHIIGIIQHHALNANKDFNSKIMCVLFPHLMAFNDVISEFQTINTPAANINPQSRGPLFTHSSCLISAAKKER